MLLCYENTLGTIPLKAKEQQLEFIFQGENWLSINDNEKPQTKLK